MTEPKWTKDKPTKDGIYYYAVSGQTNYRVTTVYIYIAYNRFDDLKHGGGMALDQANGYWCGPIELPEPPPAPEPHKHKWRTLFIEFRDGTRTLAMPGAYCDCGKKITQEEVVDIVNSCA